MLSGVVTTVSSAGRGLSAAGAVLLVLALSSVGVAVDLLSQSDLGAATVLVFVVASTAAAVLVRRRDLAATLVMPPLLFVVVVSVAVVVQDRALRPRDQALEIASSVVTRAPWLLAATAAAGLVGVLRTRRQRSDAAAGTARGADERAVPSSGSLRPGVGTAGSVLDGPPRPWPEERRRRPSGPWPGDRRRRDSSPSGAPTPHG